MNHVSTLLPCTVYVFELEREEWQDILIENKDRKLLCQALQIDESFSLRPNHYSLMYVDLKVRR